MRWSVESISPSKAGNYGEAPALWRKYYLQSSLKHQYHDRMRRESDSEASKDG